MMDRPVPSRRGLSGARQAAVGRALTGARHAGPHPGPRERLLLVAHGSRDGRAARSTGSLVHAVAAARPGLQVSAAFLDFTAPSVAEALVAGSALRVTVVPLLLTAAYHGRVDLPGVLADVEAARTTARPDTALAAPGEIRLTEVLGPVGPDDGAVRDLFVAGLRRRLAEAVAYASPADPGPADAVVLAAAGSRQIDALSTVDEVAAALGVSLGIPCLPGYASGATPTVGQAVGRLRTAGARRVAVAAYFLAPGRLYERAIDEGLRAGAVAAAAPLGDAPEVVGAVLHRATSRARVPVGP
jgi:sirohydrochlorin ferrochelatase